MLKNPSLPLCLSLGMSLLACTPGGSKVALPEKPVVEAPAQAAQTAEAEPTPAKDTSVSALGSDQAQAAPAVQTPAPAAAVATPALNESQAKVETTAVSTRLSGEVSSQRRSNLAFRVQGFVQEIKLRPGNSCHKGDVLAVLDPRDFKLNSDVARSQRDLAKVALDNAKSDFEREDSLRKENASTAAFFDKVKAGYDKAKIDYELADLNVRRAEQALSDTRLVAPYDCVVAKQMKYVGENVQSGNAVFEIYDTTDVELSFSVPERLAGQLKVGDKIQVTIPATSYKGSVEIVRLVSVVDEASRTFKVIAKAPQDQRVVPGLYAEASLR